MKKLLFLLLTTVFIYSCSEKKSEPIKFSSSTFRSSESADCGEMNIIYPNTDLCSKDYRVECYRGNPTPGEGRVGLWITDTLLLKTHFYTKNFFLDSLKYPYNGNNGNFILNIDSLTGKVGVTPWGNLKVKASNVTGLTIGKKSTPYSGTTNISGNYTVTFASAYAVAPNIQANIVGGTALQRSVITSITTTGFTVNVVSQNTNTLLGIISLVSSTSPVNGANLDVIITEK